MQAQYIINGCRTNISYFARRIRNGYLSSFSRIGYFLRHYHIAMHNSSCQAKFVVMQCYARRKPQS